MWLVVLAILIILWLANGQKFSWFETRDDQDEQNTMRFQENRFVV